MDQRLNDAINVVGLMGAGLALEFKCRYPVMFENYRRRCAAGGVMCGIWLRSIWDR